jgi:antitoxin component YwqK of YwqJK toxin-antitoxin module/peroxiredoxin
MRLPAANATRLTAMAGILFSATLLLVACDSRTVDDHYQNGHSKKGGAVAHGLQTGTWNYWYDDGKLQATGAWQGDRQIGPWTWYWPDGSLQQTGTYLGGGQRTGHWQEFHQGGKPASAGDYRNDRQDGEWTYHYADGHLYADGWFDFGVKSGLWRLWNPDTTLNSEGIYFHGLRVGPWRTPDDDKDLGPAQGFVAASVASPDGKLLAWTMGHPGTPATTLAAFALDGFDGVSWQILPDGSKRLMTSLDGHGTVTMWQRNGQLALTGYTYKGVKGGLWTYYYENGQIAAKGAWLPGQAPAVSEFRHDGQPWVANGPADPASDLTPDQLVAAADAALIKPADFGAGAVGTGALAELYHVQPVAAGTPAAAAPVAATPAPAPAATPAAPATPEAPLTWEGQSVWGAGSSWGTSWGWTIAPIPKVAAVLPADVTQLDTLAIAKPAAVAAGAPDLSPIQALPSFWTNHEEANAAHLIARYSTGEKPADDPYAGAAKPAAAETNPSLRPDLVGKPLPQTRFLASDGSILDLSSYVGNKPVVVVVLRGFAGQVCLYCASQTAALSNRIDEFHKAGAEVVILYPGAAESVPTFIKAVQSLRKDPPPLSIGLDVSLLLVRALGVEDNLSRPSSLILDKQGVVRYAYVGRSIVDRPSADDLLKEVTKYK